MPMNTLKHRYVHILAVLHVGLLRLLRRLTINDNSFLIFTAAIIGVLSALGNAALRISINAMDKLFFEDIFHWLGLSYDFPGRLLLFLMPVMGALLILPLLWKYPQECSGYGLPSLLENVIFKNAIIKPRVIFLRTITTAVTLGSGGSAGREGPIVAIGAAIGSTIGQFLKMSGSRMKVLVACGAAGGISAAFDAPIAGSMFALEIILMGDLAVYSFSPIVISAAVAAVISRAIFEKDIELLAPAFQMTSFNEFYLYCLLGLVAGLVAIVYVRLYYVFFDRFQNAPLPVWQKVLLGSMLLGAMGVAFPQVLGVGYKWMNEAILGQMPVLLMLALVFLKMIATGITLGSGLSGGVFGPSLFIGLMLGGAFGSMVGDIFPDWDHMASYALIGMGTMVAAASHAPLTAIFLLFEITGDFNIVLPVMFSCMIATSVVKMMGQESIDTVPMIRKGYRLAQGKDVTIMQRLKVRNLEKKNVDAIPVSMSFGSIQHLIARSSQMDFPVLDEEGRLVGILSFQDIRKVMFEEGLEDILVAQDLATTDVVTVHVDDNLQDALEKFGIRDFDHLPVVDSQGRLDGMISRRDIMQAYQREVQRQALRESGGTH